MGRHQRRVVAIVLSLLFFSLSKAADVSGPFGVYPNCIPPAVPLEVHSWWWEDGESVARHVHLAACLPNARDLTGDLVSVGSSQEFTVRVIEFNNPSAVNWVRWSWESDIKQVVDTDFACQQGVGELQQCEWTVDMTLDPNEADFGGMRELRLSPNVPHDILDTRQFATLNYQIYLHNGKSEQNYRSRTGPIGRSWYTAFEYANAEINYMDFFNGVADLDKSVPVVAGIVPLETRHREGQGVVRGKLWENVNFHAFPAFHATAQVGVPDQSGAVLLYDQPGNWDGTYLWDTRGLANGRNVLYLQTEESDARGMNAGALKLFFDVNNETPVLSVGSADLSWTPLSGAIAYDVVRGDLSLLHQSSGNSISSTSACHAENVTGTSTAHISTPLPGQGVWFSVRGVDDAGGIAYESQAASQSGKRDYEISTSGADCQD